MSKKYSIFITVLFCLFTFGFGAALILLPDRAFSEQENRYLTQFEAPTLDNVFGENGEFMTNFEKYVNDQFPLRDEWIHLKAWSERLLGKQENNDVYFGGDGQQTLFAQYTPPTDLEQRVDYVNQLADNVSVPVYFALIPDKSYVWADRLPGNAPLVDDGSTIQQAQGLVSRNVNFIDLSDALSGDDVFYRTDHHWSTIGAYQGYVALITAMGGSVTILDYEPTLVSDSFYGTTWSSAGAAWVRPDAMYTWVPEGGLTGSTTVTRYPNGSPVEGSFYDLSKLEVKDKYSMFLGGNQGLCIIQNPDAEGDNLLVIRDSYADSLAPFLSLDYQEVHLFDLRYNRLSLKQYVQDNGIDQVLVLYSNSNFSTDTNLALLGL
ncbi:MAG TPA: hypothetical protein IAC25_06050 [Candidatus Enterenecus stercoripullorum]|nr:hypothetical protein [Candidatus Enterenecus stercoripullorum]